MVEKLKIGNVSFANNVFMAPMAGVTDLAFRSVARDFGAGAVYSEMVSAKALHYNDRKTKELLRTDDGERPLFVQIFGREPTVMAEAAGIITRDFHADIIDINMGCPAPKIAGNGDGGALLKNPELIEEIVRAVASSTALPVTVKVRSGWDEDSINIEEVCRAAERGGAAAIAVHGRTVRSMYSGNVDLEIIKRAVVCTNLPIIGNGDISCPEDARTMLEKSGCAAIMIGRGALGAPWIFRDILRYLEDGVLLPAPTFPEIVEIIREHFRRVSENKGEYTALRETRKFALWYVRGQRGANSIKRALATSEDMAVTMKLLEDFARELSIS